MNNGLAEGWVYSLVIDPSAPSTIYAGTHSMGLFRSTDGAATWSDESAGLVAGDHPNTDNLRIRSLAMSPFDPRSLMVGVWGGSGVLVTETAGDTWQVAGERPLGGLVRTVAYNPAVPSMIYAGRALGGARYLGGPVSNTQWRTFPDQTGGGWEGFSIVSAIAVNPTDGRTVFIGVYDLGILRSTDGGRTWMAVNRGLSATSVTALAAVPGRPGTLIASTRDSGIFRSTDGGASWSLHPWTGPWDRIADLAVDPEIPDLLYVVTGSGEWGLLTFQSGEPVNVTDLNPVLDRRGH
jgi:hypothetical protein